MIVLYLKSGLQFEEICQVMGYKKTQLKVFLKKYYGYNEAFCSEFEYLKYQVRIQSCIEEIKETAKQVFIYPLILLVVSMTMKVILLLVLEPQVSSMMSDIKISSVNNNLVVISAIVMLTIEVVGVLLSIFITIVFKSSLLRVLLYSQLWKNRIFQVVVTYVSCLVCEEIHCLIQEPISYAQLAYKCRLYSKYHEVRWVGFNIDRLLEQGYTIEECFARQKLQSIFITLVRSGIKTDTLEEQLIRYSHIGWKLLEYQVLSICKAIKFFVYSQVMLTICMYYYFLLQPMRMMEEML